VNVFVIALVIALALALWARILASPPALALVASRPRVGRMRQSAWVLGICLLPALGAADRLELLGPNGTVSPDGFDVAVRRLDDAGKTLDAKGVTAEATGAAVSAGRGDGLARVFTLTPAEGSHKVTLKLAAGAVTTTHVFAVGPPAERVSLKLEPAAPVKNRDTSAELTIEMRNADGQPDAESAPPVVRANVGTLEHVERVGAGLYKARYVLPLTRFPEVAVVVAFSAWPHPQSVHGSFGALRVPLAAFVELPGKAEANADLSMVIAGQKFGPVHTERDGRFKIPVVVPPGYGIGMGTAVDRLGNKRTNPIDLALPPTDQLACVVNPTQLPADGQSRARVLCATSDPFGNIATGAKVALSAQRGRLSPPKALDNGVSEFTWVAPAELGGGREDLFASWRQGSVSAKEDLQIALLQGPAAHATLVTPEAFVHLGGSLAFTAFVKDALDRPRAGAHLALVSGGGRLDDINEVKPGELKWRWHAPIDAQTGAAALAVRAWGPVGSEPARIACWVEAQRLWAAVTDLAGLPVPSQPLKVGPHDLMTDAEGVVSLGPLQDTDISLKHRDWPGLTADVHVRENGALVFPRSVRPGSAPASHALTLGPSVPVVVRVEVKGRVVTWWVETPDGQLVPGRDVEVELSEGKAGPAVQRDGHTQFEVQGIKAPATVSVVDVATQVLAMAEVAP
jgi:hypothetical protein